MFNRSERFAQIADFQQTEVELMVAKTLGIESVNSIESMGSIPNAVVAVAWLLFAGWGAGRLLRMILRDMRAFEASREMVYVVAGLHLVAICGVSLGMTGVLGGSKSLILLGMFSLTGIVEAWRSRLLIRLMRSRICFRSWKPTRVWLMVSANCYVEAFQLLELFAIFVVLDKSSKLDVPSRLIEHSVLLGILVGGSAAVKLTGVITIVIPLT